MALTEVTSHYLGAYDEGALEYLIQHLAGADANQNHELP